MCIEIIRLKILLLGGRMKVLSQMVGEVVKSSAIEKATEFISNEWTKQELIQMFIEAGKEVAYYERDNTEESELRQFCFCEKNMKSIAEYMSEVDEFRWMSVLHEGIQDLLSRSSMCPQNQKSCKQHFMQIVQRQLKKKRPELMSRSLQGENFYNVQNMAKQVGNIDRSMSWMQGSMENLMKMLYESRQHERQEGADIETDSETEKEIFDIPKWNLGHMHVEGIWGSKEKWEKEICDLTETWKAEREQYPGWYIPPYAVCEKLSMFTNEYGLLQKHTVIDLHRMFLFVYEFVWRKETCLDRYSDYEIYHIYEIWKKYMIEIENWNIEIYDERKNDIEKWFYIGQVLLRNSRENYKDDMWHEIYGQLKVYEKYGVNGNIDLQLEKIKHDFYHLDVAAMRRDISKCHLQETNYEQRLQILGMRAELNETETVVSELERLLNDLNKANMTKDQNRIYFLTLQACVLQLYSLCTQGMFDYYNQYESNLDKIQNIENWIEKKKALFDWTSWKKGVEDSLLRWHVKKYEKDDAFELMREKITIMSSENECIPAFRFFRVLEKLALPYKSGHVTLLGKLELPWMEAIQEISDTLGLFLLCRSTESNTIKTLVDRYWISGISIQRAETSVEFLIRTLRINIDEIGEMEQMYGLGMVSNIAANVPELLIRYMSRCQETIQKDAMLLIKMLMENESLLSDFPVTELCIGVLRQVSERVKVHMLDEMLRTKIVEHRTLYGYSEGIDFFAFYFQKEKIGSLQSECRVETETIEWLLEEPEEEGYVWKSKIIRLETLNNLRLLNEKQQRAYARLLWSYVSEVTGLPKMEEFHLFVFEKLPCYDPSSPVCSVKGWFLNHSLRSKFDETEATNITMGKIPYLDELILVCQNMEKRYWSVEEADTLIGYITEYWDVLQRKLEKNEMSGLVESELCNRAQKMECAAAELCRNVEVVSKEAVGKLRTMMYQMQKFEISIQELRVQIEEGEDFIDNICEEMNCVKTEIAVGAFTATEKYILVHPDAPSSQKLFEELIRLIKYRKLPGLASAVCALHNLAYVRCPIILNKDNFRKMEQRLIQFERELQIDNIIGIPVKEVLNVRKLCMSLAFQLFQIKGMDSGVGVLRWKALSQDLKEINEVRNEWVWE